MQNTKIFVHQPSGALTGLHAKETGRGAGASIKDVMISDDHVTLFHVPLKLKDPSKDVGAQSTDILHHTSPHSIQRSLLMEPAPTGSIIEPVRMPRLVEVRSRGDARHAPPGF